MKQRCLSIFLSMTLMASVIAGAISVSICKVNADSLPDPIVWSDFYTYMLTAAVSESERTVINNLNTIVTQNWDNATFNIFLITDVEHLNFSLLLVDNATVNANYRVWRLNQLTSPERYEIITDTRGWSYSYFTVLGVALFHSGAYTQLLTTSQRVRSTSRSTAFSFLNTTAIESRFPCPLDLAAGFNCYSLRDITNSGFSANILAEPLIEDFELVDFWLGERHYLSITDQFWLSRMDPEKMGYGWGVFTAGVLNEAYDYGDIVNIPGASNFVDVQFINVPVDESIYAVDITDWNLNVITDIDYSAIYEIRDNNLVTVAEASNVPLNIERPGGQSDPSTQIWNEWNTYISNYPNYNIVPQQLVPQFYGKQASSCKPCEVAIPDSLWNARHQVTSYGQDIFEYHFPLVSSPAYNYDLFDVCVLSRQGIITGNILEWDYTLMWWYSDTSNPKSTKIQDLNFDVLMEMFDIIIVVDDPDLVLMDSNGDLVYTGDYEYGFTYSADSFSQDAVLYGFAFVTEKAVQKQLLFNFNDGISKTYDLMSQYIEKRDAWDNSFLQWTTSLFTEFQTLWGSIDDIYKLLFSWSGLLESIDEKLGQIAENTSEDDPGYWFISFYNWVKRWEPSNSDFANWVDSWDDYTDDLPDPGSGVTVIPFPTAIPTAAVAGG